MTEYGLEPAFVKIDYSTAFGAHSHLICTREWNPVPVTGVLGSYNAWSGVDIDGEDMIDAMVAAMAPMHIASTTLNLATIFTKAGEGAPAVPVASKALGVVGTNPGTDHTKAIQKTFNFRTTGIQPAKLVFLDVPHTNADFNKQFFTAWSGEDVTLFITFGDVGWAWAGRDNTRVMSAVSITWNLNQQLRKQYGMA